MNTEDWIPIAEQVSVEMDSAKLASLVTQLCSALTARRELAENQTKRELEQILTSYPGVKVVGWI